MSFFSNLFKGKRKEDIAPNQSLPYEVEILFEIDRSIKELLNKNEYIAQSDYFEAAEKFASIKKHFEVMLGNDLFREYCQKNSLEFTKTLAMYNRLNELGDLIEECNENYLAREKKNQKDYLDNILKEVDPAIVLDENQRDVVLTDEDYCLVIAGAGAGKTTTVAAKVKYLVEKKGIDPSQILVISFTNKAVNELKDKINKDLSIGCPITTFHSAGNAIIRKKSDDEFRVVNSSTLYYVLMNYFKTTLLNDKRMLNDIIMFFGSYFDAPFEGDDLNRFFDLVANKRFETIRSDLGDFVDEVQDKKTKRLVTISNEILRSREEVEIANFLYLHNIEYHYEPAYPYRIDNFKRIYTPDFVIKQDDKVAYIEHFGITEDGKNTLYDEETLERYKKAINDKVLIHRKYGTKLIYTFSSYKDGRTLMEHLRDELVKNGFELNARPQREIVEKLVTSEQSRYVSKLIRLVSGFISNFKTNAFGLDDFSRMSHSTNNVRTKLFLDICKGCYLEYQRYLNEQHLIDFDDMINESARILREVKDMKTKLDFKYIIVDEYQDISKQRFDLTKELSEITDAKIIAVGDDWQSIYAFSGSDITLFTHFVEIMGYGKLLRIVNTYRNAQEVIDIAGNFIQKNPGQIHKRLKSPKNIKDPVIIYTYDSTRKKATDFTRSGANYALAKAVETAIEQILIYDEKERGGKSSHILLLGRFGFDGDHLEKSGLFEYQKRGGRVRSVKYPRVEMTFMTAHSSKGLGYDNVIVINGKNETYGFPSKIEDDPVLNFVIKRDTGIEYAEERRLFYVAMTRTKNRVFFIAPEKNPSEFLLEIKKDYKTVRLYGDWQEVYERIDRKYCPICGFPLQLRYKKAYGLKLHLCTNEPELCGFITNDLRGRKMSIQKCNCCTDGYMVVKCVGNGEAFLGCTNYKKEGNGCNNMISMANCYLMNGLGKLESHTQEDAQRHENKILNEKMEYQAAESPIIYRAEKMQDYTKEQKNTLEQHSKPIPRKAALKEIYYNSNSLIDIIGDILQCVKEISEKNYFGITIAISVLRGSQNEKVRKNSLDKTTVYGKRAQMSYDDLRIITKWLIEKKYLLQTRGHYPVLHLTHEGNYYKEIITTQQLKALLNILEKSKNGESLLEIE
ncbi:MAG: UvrD-helicase domain-containing protein [Peptostreptococcaceae bacterium]|nr:UvrD-helicase domain-containing protein [Peptostreptococcaceae bacterium]